VISNRASRNTLLAVKTARDFRSLGSTATLLPGSKHAFRRLIISVLIDLADLQPGHCELRFAMGDYFRARSQGTELPYLVLVSGPPSKPAPSREKEKTLRLLCDCVRTQQANVRTRFPLPPKYPKAAPCDPFP
jgi:hypothetical protein